jgi:hypothetical protein
MKNKLYPLIALTALICFAGLTAHARLQKDAPTKQTWEYLEVELDIRFNTTAKLNTLGSQGWELVDVTSSCPSSPDSTISCRYWAYMKRPK